MKEKSHIQLFENIVPQSNMLYGKFQGVTDGVEKLKSKGDF